MKKLISIVILTIILTACTPLTGFNLSAKAGDHHVTMNFHNTPIDRKHSEEVKREELQSLMDLIYKIKADNLTVEKEQLIAQEIQKLESIEKIKK